jgi:hypothetical protein
MPRGKLLGGSSGINYLMRVFLWLELPDTVVNYGV